MYNILLKLGVLFEIICMTMCYIQSNTNGIIVAGVCTIVLAILSLENNK